MTPRVWDVIGLRRWGYLVSLLLIVPGLVAMIAGSVSGRGALNWGIDFTGGDFFHLRLTRPVEVAEVRGVVDRHATGESIIQRSADDLLIRTRPLSDDARRALLADLRRQFGQLTVLREEEVGPRIGQELRNVAILAVVLGLVLQVLYISFRFKSIRYAVTADIALLHDLLVVAGVYALTWKEVNSGFVAILLTVVGYSINDTIVVYDRIRENLAMRTREPFDRLVNRSLLEVLVRSLTTGVSAILAIAAVYLFGGVTIRDFAFGLMIGIVAGSYSSIFNASALLVDWHLWAERRAGRGRAGALAEPAAPPVPATAPASAVPAGAGAGAPRRRRSRRR